ncbi:hypothetical protein HNP84_004991 [Thermocatellispora tengchongensis]|uniref:Uncharacterized protein n=1 Tax=Thermocatellispora tengchongensis TaxID=1073253 RepID=A0A840PGU0_9ACTN|nr:hypothetical protein [Thermocatellispora tengchongensis]MBB5135255.1 hypothetical protein [Thermocatellispora tengchongensis]
MTETDPEGREPRPQVPDEREGAEGMTEPSGVDEQGPPAQIPDDRRGAAGLAGEEDEAREKGG